MNFEIVKTVTKFVKKSKNTIIKYAPQILAVAGAGCFVAGTYCAIKETPEAMRRLEEKEALDPNMTKPEKVAVMAPAYKKTAAPIETPASRRPFLSWPHGTVEASSRNPNAMAA